MWEDPQYITVRFHKTEDSAKKEGEQKEKEEEKERERNLLLPQSTHRLLGFYN